MSITFLILPPLLADNHILVMQQHRLVDVRLVHHTELGQSRTAIAFHGPAVLGTDVQNIVATGSFLQVSFGNTTITNLAEILQMNCRND